MQKFIEMISNINAGSNVNIGLLSKARVNRLPDICRSEGLLNGIFHPCALRDRGLAGWESCRRVVAVVVAAVGVIWKFRLTFRPGNYIWSFFIRFWGRGERYLRRETGVLHLSLIHI